MVASLMDDRADLDVFVVLIGIDGRNSHVDVFLQQYSLPSTLWTNTSVPTFNLSVVIIAPTSLEKADIPFEPSSRIKVKVKPAGGFPFGECLAARNLELVECW